jgi:ABC-type lipoprotein release transport system permease subunit
MALGASAARIVRVVLSRGMVQMGIGLGAGLAGAVVATRLMAGLPGMASTKDPWMFRGVVAVLAATGLPACLLPARRAAQVPPTEALRTG